MCQVWRESLLLLYIGLSNDVVVILNIVMMLMSKKKFKILRTRSFTKFN